MLARYKNAFFIFDRIQKLVVCNSASIGNDKKFPSKEKTPRAHLETATDFTLCAKATPKHFQRNSA